MKIRTADNVAIVNFIFTPLVYGCILLPTSIHLNTVKLIPVFMVLHMILLYSIIIYLLKRKVLKQ